MPKLGETVDEVLVLEWSVSVGDVVSQGDTLMTVETDKVEAELPSPVSGTVVELLGDRRRGKRRHTRLHHRDLSWRSVAVESREARDALSRLVESWHEPWASRWARAMVATRRPGDLDSQTVNDLVSQVRRLLDHLDPTDAPSVNRTELAAKLFGSAHALDERTKLAGAITQALQFGVERGFQLEPRELWKAAGIRGSRVSAPVLTWSLPVEGGSFLDEQVRQASAGGLPLHISLFALNTRSGFRNRHWSSLSRTRDSSKPPPNVGCRPVSSRRMGIPPLRLRHCCNSCASPGPRSGITATSIRRGSESVVGCTRTAPRRG